MTNLTFRICLMNCDNHMYFVVDLHVRITKYTDLTLKHSMVVPLVSVVVMVPLVPVVSMISLVYMVSVVSMVPLVPLVT